MIEERFEDRFEEDLAVDDGRPLAVVTGASSGVGFELSKELAERGYDLIMAAANAEKLRDAARVITDGSSGIHVEIVSADLSRAHGVTKLYQAIQRDGRSVDVLAANAGDGMAGECTNESALEDEIALINLNITSHVQLIKLVSHDMESHGGGDIVITSAMSETMPGTRTAVYAASKAFLRSFGHAIRRELSERGVNVTLLMSDAPDAKIFEGLDIHHAKAEVAEDDPAKFAEAALQALREHDRREGRRD
ncbi:MAG TPA: SDR family NAD(P)-dependent oxidoreductase [Steroidobacteraceae bacterium]|nr:SDR family NAD(P)-dependent oxidoreductase [Steroidobacteraceae bacterium]